MLCGRYEAKGQNPVNASLLIGPYDAPGTPKVVALRPWDARGPAAANSIVRLLQAALPGIEIEHEDIVGLMPAMQMEFPVSDAALLKGLALNDHIDFTIDNTAGDMKVITIKKK